MRNSLKVLPKRSEFRSVSIWANVPMGPPDKILGLNEEFKANKNPNKVNLGVGAYRDDHGKPYVLESVREAEKIIMEKKLDHEYAGIAGIQEFVNLSLNFGYGTDSPALKENRVAGIQTLSGTGACRVAGEFLARTFGRGTKIYLPDLTWGNHLPIMKNSGLELGQYRYFDPTTCSLAFESMEKDLKALPDSSIVLLHACAHNPTGCDPSPEQWSHLSSLLLAKGHTVLFDCAYQGFASGDAEKDAFSLREFVRQGHTPLLAQSYAKNFGLYGERVGALSVVGQNTEEKERLLSQLKLVARPMYSNPPLYGARIVQTVLSSPTLQAQWRGECKKMAERILTMRDVLRGQLEGRGAGGGRSWKHVTDQIGMFCFSGLTRDQVLRMRSEFHIYCTEDGRLSLTGINSSNIDYLVNAIDVVTK